MSNQPRVSVLIATYNYANYITVALQSIYEQTYGYNNIEVIIIDDGSIDNTEQVINSFNKLKDIKYYYQENSGKASATRKGIELAKSEFLFILDADDYFYPECISKVVKHFEKDNSVVQVSYLADRLDEATGLKISQISTNKFANIPTEGLIMLYNNIFKEYNIGLGSTFAAKTAVLKTIKIPNEVDMYIDLYMYLKLSLLGKIVQLNEVLSVFRRHNNSYSEGSIHHEIKTVRVLRYIKSSSAIYNSMRTEKLPAPILQWLRLFYNQHLVGSSKFVRGNRISSALDMLVLATLLLHRFKNKTTFIKNNIRIFKNGYL